MVTASRPTTWSAASMRYHCRLCVSFLAMKVDIGGLLPGTRWRKKTILGHGPIPSSEARRCWRRRLWRNSALRSMNSHSRLVQHSLAHRSPTVRPPFAHLAQGTPNSMRILLADDDEITRLAVSTALRGWGY